MSIRYLVLIGMVAVAFVCERGRSDDATKESLEAMSLRISYELQHKHFRWWESEKDNRKFIDQLNEEFLDEHQKEWRIEFWSAIDREQNVSSPPPNSLTSEDEESIRSLNSETPLVARNSDDGTIYYAAIKQRKSCMTCHGPTQPPFAQLGDVLWYAKVQKETKKGGSD